MISRVEYISCELGFIFYEQSGWNLARGKFKVIIKLQKLINSLQMTSHASYLKDFIHQF